MLRMLKYPLLALAVCLIAVPLARAEEKKKESKGDAKAVIAVFAFDGPIMEKPQGEEFPFISPTRQTSLKDIVERMKKAKDDKNVKAVVLLLDEVELTLAQSEELRQALHGIKAAGKEVYAHVDSVLMTRSLALLAGASRISVTPTTIIIIAGFNAESPYVRGLLDAIGVKPDFLTCGEYKSAAEIFMRKGPSPEAAKMRNWLLDSLYESYQKMVAKGRGVKPERVRQWIDGAMYTPEQAVQQGIIDSIQHRQDFEAELRKKFGEEVKFDRKYGKKQQGEGIDLSSPLGALQLWAKILEGGKKKATGKDVIGIVYVDGAILPGSPEPSPFETDSEAYSTPIRKALDKIAEDKHVKAVVLRVNSPGGSAVASEIILNATKRVKAKKPLVVSMGNVAGSGGYYVSMGADTIFADATTITASIGVVGGKLATTDMWNKIGITWDSSRRGANAGLLSSDAVFTPAERKKMQSWMNDIYGVFKGHVVAARGAKLKKPIDELAAGRVFTGQQALDLGLVDKIGTLEDAIRNVAQQAKLKDYEVRVYPEPKNFMEVLLEELSDGDRDSNHIALPASEIASPHAFSILDLALPHLKGLDRERLETVKTALRRLDLLQQERAVLMMPDISVRDPSH
ncbi:MAG: signal peptide peptidase SppA [Thermoguttaceae bacterium]